MNSEKQQFEYTANLLLEFSKLCTRVLNVVCEKASEADCRELNRYLSICKDNIQVNPYNKDIYQYINITSSILDEDATTRHKQITKILKEKLYNFQVILNLLPEQHASNRIPAPKQEHSLTIYYNIDEALECLNPIMKDWHATTVNFHNGADIILQKPCVVFTVFNIISRTEPELIRELSEKLWTKTDGNSIIILAIMKKDKSTAPNDVNNVYSGINKEKSDIWTIYYKNDLRQSDRPQMILDENEFKTKLAKTIKDLK